MADNYPNDYTNVPYIDPRLPVLDVQPLNSVPYMGPPLMPMDHPFPAPRSRKNSNKNDNKSKNKNCQPQMVLLPSSVTEEDAKSILSSVKGGVVLRGAALGKIGPLIGARDIAETEDEYLFWVSLPGVDSDRRRFCWNIEPSGKVEIRGVSTTGEAVVVKCSQVFVMQTQNLCPPGVLSVTFNLPGPVQNETFRGSFNDGILFGKIKKVVV